MIKVVLIVFVLYVFGGCTHIPTEEEIKNADFGRYPDKYREIVREYYSKSLFEVYNVHYSNWKGPLAGYASNVLGEIHYGFKVCVDISAKNRMGAHIGNRQHYVVIRNDNVVHADGGYDKNVGADNEISEICNLLPPYKSEIVRQ